MARPNLLLLCAEHGTDNQGNILSKSEYYSPSTGTEEEPLNTITYDAIGNPVRYYDGRTFTWEQGRRLKASTLADETRVSYQYNSDGIRTQKTVGSITTTYLVDDAGTIRTLKEGNETLIFMYDSTGRREGFIWYTGTVKNGAYYYLYNAQSDVIGIVASDFTPVVFYEYNAWGNPYGVSGIQADTVGRLNSFRYRGYCYDEESGFYYLGGVKMVRVGEPEHAFNEMRFNKFCDKYKFVFPETFVNYLKKYNDADLEMNIVYLPDNECYIRYFYGTSEEESSDISSVYEWYIERLPFKCVPIADPDFGNQICMSLASDTYGKIYFWDHEIMDTDEEYVLSLNDMVWLADSFEELLDKILESPYL